MDDPQFESRPIQHMSLLWNVQTGFGAHPASYLAGTRLFAGGKVSGTFWILTSIYLPRLQNDWSYTSTYHSKVSSLYRQIFSGQFNE